MTICPHCVALAVVCSIAGWSSVRCFVQAILSRPKPCKKEACECHG